METMVISRKRKKSAKDLLNCEHMKIGKTPNGFSLLLMIWRFQYNLGLTIAQCCLNQQTYQKPTSCPSSSDLNSWVRLSFQEDFVESLNTYVEVY